MTPKIKKPSPAGTIFDDLSFRDVKYSNSKIFYSMDIPTSCVMPNFYPGASKNFHFVVLARDRFHCEP